MSITNVLTELWPAITQQQGQKVVAAFVSTQGQGPGGGIPSGMTNAQFAELCLRRFIRGVVRGADRQAGEVTIQAAQAVTDSEFAE